jgi:hypothetical protein
MQQPNTWKDSAESEDVWYQPTVRGEDRVSRQHRESTCRLKSNNMTGVELSVEGIVVKTRILGAIYVTQN